MQNYGPIFHIGPTITQSGHAELYTKIIHGKSLGRRSFQFFIFLRDEREKLEGGQGEVGGGPERKSFRIRGTSFPAAANGAAKNRRDTGKRASTCESAENSKITFITVISVAAWNFSNTQLNLRFFINRLSCKGGSIDRLSCLSGIIVRRLTRFGGLFRAISGKCTGKY